MTTPLIELGADPNARDKWGDAPLHYAAATSPEPPPITTLIEHGAGIEARNMDNHTPLHRAAARYGNATTIRALLQLGADPDARDGQGQTPLDLARLNPDRRDDTAMIQALEAAVNPPASAPAAATPDRSSAPSM